MIHIPILRQGKPYKSIDVNRAFHYRTGEQLAEISQANIGLIRAMYSRGHPSRLAHPRF